MPIENHHVFLTSNEACAWNNLFSVPLNAVASQNSRQLVVQALLWTKLSGKQDMFQNLQILSKMSSLRNYDANLERHGRSVSCKFKTSSKTHPWLSAVLPHCWIKISSWRTVSAWADADLRACCTMLDDSCWWHEVLHNWS